MPSLAVINQKGGVGKTTTAVNLGAALAEASRRVAIIDLDPQAHASLHLGVEPNSAAPSMYEVLMGAATLGSTWQIARERLWVARATIDLAAVEVELAGARRGFRRRRRPWLRRWRAGRWWVRRSARPRGQRRSPPGRAAPALPAAPPLPSRAPSRIRKHRR